MRAELTKKLQEQAQIKLMEVVKDNQILSDHIGAAQTSTQELINKLQGESQTKLQLMTQEYNKKMALLAERCKNHEVRTRTHMKAQRARTTCTHTYTRTLRRVHTHTHNS